MRMFVLALAGGLVAAGPALAQATGPNGGLVGGTGTHQTELVVSPTELVVYLLENSKPHNTAGTSARAVVQQAGKTTTLNLANQDGKLVAKLPAALQKDAIVVITGKDGHGDQFNARYVIR